MTQLSESIEQIETVGYTHLKGVYDKSTMEEALRRIKAQFEATKDSQSDHVPFLNIGQPTVYNLQNKDMFFLEILFGSGLVEGILKRFLNDEWFKQIPKEDPSYVIRSYISRSTNTVTPMHIDSFIPYLGERPYIMQYAIILEAQNEKNGATVVVPKTHKSGEYATQESFADAISIESEVGDVVMWDSRLWHGTTANNTDGTRWSIIATFCRWWMKQHWNIPMNLPQEIYEQLTDSQKAVMGFCSMSHNDETEGIDLKCGYDSLKPRVDDYRRSLIS